MKDKLIDENINKLEQRALKSYKIVEIYKKDLYSKVVFDFLKTQKFIPIENIDLIVKSTKEDLPIGSIMIHLKSKETVGFVGTLYSKKTLKNKKFIFCNIHSWIVDKNHRLYSFFLIQNLVKKKINLTAFTAVETLKGLLKKFGFEKKIIKEKFYFNLSLFTFKNDKLKIVKIDYIAPHIQIFINKCQKQLIKIKGVIIKKKGIRLFKILYLSDPNAFKKNYNGILNLISKKYKIYFFSAYIVGQNDSFFPNLNFISLTKKRDIYVKSIVNIDKSDLLESDLAF